MIAAFALLLVLLGGSDGITPSQAVIYFPSRDLCEAAAAQVVQTVPGRWQHVCLPMVGAAVR